LWLLAAGYRQRANVSKKKGKAIGEGSSNGSDIHFLSK